MTLPYSKPPHCRPIPPPRVIFCDVDGTLIVSGMVNARLVDWLRLRHADGFELVLWSSRGREHAEKAAFIAGFKHATTKTAAHGMIFHGDHWNIFA